MTCTANQDHGDIWTWTAAKNHGLGPWFNHSATRGHMNVRVLSLHLESGLCLRVESQPGPCRYECPTLPPRVMVLPGPGLLRGAISGFMALQHLWSLLMSVFLLPPKTVRIGLHRVGPALHQPHCSGEQALHLPRATQWVAGRAGPEYAAVGELAPRSVTWWHGLSSCPLLLTTYCRWESRFQGHKWGSWPCPSKATALWRVGLHLAQVA